MGDYQAAIKRIDELLGEAEQVDTRIKELEQALRGMVCAAKRGWDDCSVCGVELGEGEAHREDCEVFLAERALAGEEAEGG